MDIDEVVENQEMESPAGEVVSPDELAEEITTGPATDEMHDELAAIQGEIDAAYTPDEKAKGQAKLNKAFARIRTEGKQAREAERKAIEEAAYLRGRLESTQSAPAQPQLAAEPKQPHAPATFDRPRPNEDDFESYAEYEEAKESWLIERAKHEARQELEAMRRQQESMDYHRQQAQSTQQWIQQAPKELADFEATVCRPVEQGGPPFTNEMVEIVRQSPVGHRLLYQLAKNPAEVVRLASLPPHLAALEIARREARLTPASGTIISNAPSPIQPLNSRGSAGETPIDELGMNDFVARRNAEEFGPNWKTRT